jgi:hypothetical protein
MERLNFNPFFLFKFGGTFKKVLKPLTNIGFGVTSFTFKKTIFSKIYSERIWMVQNLEVSFEFIHL